MNTNAALDGWKTYLASIAMLAVACWLIWSSMQKDTPAAQRGEMFTQGIALLPIALAFMGVRRKQTLLDEKIEKKL